MAKIIKGRKGGSSKQRTPTEQPDDLQSIAKAKILVALGEGEYAGSLTGKDIYLDGTPLENADGSQNFSGVSWEFRPGTQAQNYIQGIPGTENEISVGTDISSQTAWTHTFTNTQLSAIRLRLKWSALFTQEDDGDLVGNTVKYAIDLQTDGGSWQTVVDTAVTGKTTSGYERSHRVDLPQAGATWTVRLRKITPDANSAKIGDNMALLSYTEVIDAKLRYPNTALLYIEFDSSQFNGSIPQISCEPKMRVIRVPDTYDPETRAYNGTWTGSFKWAWTDNPAWIFYDLVVTDRFGLGNRLTAANIDKWMLYQVAQYCDQLVPDGKGGDGLEPRYTCNVYIQDRNAAYTVLRDFAAIFRGMTCWNGQQIIALADMPRDIDFTYTRANVIDGKFRYSSSTSKTRYTNALVSWSDPANAFSDAMEPSFVKELVARYGFNQLELTAIGCTRQSEAHRKGLWGILTNNKDRMVTFDVGLDGKIPQPGYVIGVADEMLAGKVNGGRISKVDGRVIILDRDIDANAGDRLQVNLPSGTSQSRTIQSINGRRQVTVTTAFSEPPEAESVWAIESDDLFLQQYRVVGVKDNNNGTYTITGTSHDPDKYARIDTGAIIDQRPVSVVPPGNQAPPDGILLTSFSVVNQGISVETLQANWDAVQNAIAYEAQWRRNDGNWINVPRSSTTSFEVSGIYAGRYLVRVRAINAAEISSGWAYSEEKTLTGKVGEPLPPLALTTVSLTAGIEIRWEFPEGAEDTLRTELQYSPDQSGNGAMPLTDLAYPGKQYQQMGLQIAAQFWYRARLVDRLGNASPWTSWVHGMSSDNVSDYYQQLDDALKGSDTYEELNKGIQDNSAAADAAQQAADAAQGTADQAAKDVAAQGAIVTQQGKDLAANIAKTNDTTNKLAQEVKDRAAGDTATAQKAASDTAAAVAKAETDDAAVAKQAADNLLSAKREVEAAIETTNVTMQDGFDSLAQQMASISAGTGEQFDSLKIWYFDKDNEGWSSDDGGTKPLPTTDDGWILPADSISTMRSPSGAGTLIDGSAYKYLRLRIKKVGNPAWGGRLYWIGADETGWTDGRRLVLPAPDFDPATGISTIAIPDIPWQASGTIRRLRLDFSQGGAADADNYYAVDWLAVGRPTPGASQAQIQDLKTAMTAADSAEAMERNQLAVQLRGNEEGTDPNKLVSGLLFEERKIRVTAEKAIGSRVDTLRVDYDKSTAAATQRMDTLASDLQSTASKTDQVAADLVSANGVIAGHTLAIQKIEGDVQTIDGKVQANASQIAGVESKVDNIRIGGVNLIPNSGELTGKSPSATERYRANAVRILTRAAGATDFAVLDYTLAAPVDGTEYVLSFYAKAKTDKTPVRCFLNTPDATIRAETSQGVIVERPAGYNGDVTVTLSTSWSRYWVKYKRKPGLSGTAYLVVARLDGAAAAREAWISSPMFESGNIVSDWSQAPADSASSEAVQQLTTRVTTAENTLATTAQQTTALKSQITTGNLLLNGDLINKADNWQLSGTGAGAPVYDAVMKGLTTTEPAMRIANGTKIPVEAGQVLTLTFGFKTDDATISIGTQNFTMGLIENWGNPTNWLVQDNTWFAGITTGYQTRTLTFTIPNDFKGRWCYLRMACGGWTPSTARVYLQGFMLTASNGIAGKADASAVQDLQSQVTKNGDDIATNASAITSLGGRIDATNAEVAKKATTAALDSLKATVTQQGKDITAQAERTTALTNTVNQNKQNADSAIAANGQAISGLSQTVSQQGDRITSQGQQITQVSNKVDTVNTDLGKRIDQKADNKTVQDLSATVTQQGKDITAANQAITSLKGRVSTVEEGLAKAATADAVSKLDTRVTNAEGKIESQGTAITGINVALNSQTAAGGDYILNPTFDPAYPSMGFTRRDTVDSNDDDGIPYDADIPAGAPRRYVARLASRDHQLNTPPWPVKAGQVFEISVWVAAKAGSNAAFNMYIGSATGPNTGAVAYAALPGSVAPTQTWTEKKYRWTVPANFPRGYMRPFLQVNQNAPYGSVWYATDFHCREITAAQGAQTAADAAAGAVTQLDAKVTQQSNTITSQGQAITAITGRVSNLESGQSANSSAIQSLTQRTTAAEGKIETNSQAITSVTGAVNAMLNRGENLANDFNFMSGSALWGIQGNTRNKVEFGDFGDGKPGVQMTQLDSTLYTGLFANQKAPLPHNTPRRYQVIVKAKGVSGAMNFMVRRFNYLGNVAGTYENCQFSATDTWATYAAEFSAPSSATVDGSVFALYCYPNASVIQIDYIAIYDITDAVAIDANTSAVTQLQQTVTQQGQDIAANASATTAVSASLNAAMADVDNKITGNLILNGGFERDFTNWTAPAQATVMSAQNPHSGKKIVKYVAATTTTLLSNDTVITAVKGRTYKFGAWLRAKAGSTMQPNTQQNNKVRFAYLDNSVILEARFDPATMPTGSVWQEYSNTYTATKDGTMSVSINAFLNAGEIYIDDVYVIDITDRVELDATAGAVSNLQSTVTQQGKDIASNASAITSVNASIGALQSQGLNPWCDGSFESYTANQQLGSSSLARVSTDVYRNGQKSLKITRNNGENGNSDKMIGNWLAVRGGGKYRFSLWAYMASDMSTPNGWNVSVGLFARGENGGANQWPEAVRISETNISRGKWVLLTGVATVGADRSIAQMWISTRGPNGGAGYSLYLDDISIVDVTDAQEAQDTATGAANAVTQLTATVTQQGKDITAQAGQITSLGSRVGDAESRITKQDETIASNGLAMATGFNQMRSMIGDNSAAITSTNKTVADLEKSTTEQITTLTSQVGDMSATVQQTASTVADLNGKLGAQWGVKVNTSSGGKNYVAGLQLGIDGSGQSQFLVQADQFGIYVPNGDKSNLAFGVDGNGAYMQQAMARNLVIDFAQISDNIRSTNYQPGVAGAGWSISKNGGAEFNNITARGRIFATDGEFNGVVRARDGSFRGTIDATDGTFRGTVQASRFIGDICSAGVFPEGKRPDITHYDSGNNGVPKTYAVSAVVACGVSFVGKIRVWIKGIKVSEIGVSGAADNASTRYIPVFGALSGVTDTNVRCEVTIDGSGIANYNGGFVIMTRSTGSWA
ncbi:TipJ family phage tail tip protein [Klebsiella aerogenes]|uniref:TipJ family phage tail tip protein n=1 Tax=Klebsiella aerogenes TaxID=548 RepID=UPI002A83FF0B|nr:carbohydrate binding domain-containing protein [Klebsiella aerogenes]WPR97261.1 carbohydrate binding domain-containing protein [Klebsiella aerogenes]WPS36544.1 carbohydrate binding domain-containing protein [Klebsiella aerogenes]